MKGAQGVRGRPWVWALASPHWSIYFPPFYFGLFVFESKGSKGGRDRSEEKALLFALASPHWSIFPAAFYFVSLAPTTSSF
jgi:hypothetical protein